MEKRSRNIAVDRISDLPESIIHDHIMSRLSRGYRARTRILSKTWYHLYKTYPALDIDFESFFNALHKENPDLKSRSPEYLKSLKSFRKHIKKSTRNFHRGKLRLHSLFVSNFRHSYPEFKVDLNSWIELALKNRVEIMKLYCCLYKLPQSVYYASTLTTLKLSGCVLDQPLSVFRSLRELSLRNCHIISGPLVLKHSDCPVLESLALNDCKGFDSIHISNLARLQRIDLMLYKAVEVRIASQSVEKISFVEWDYSDHDESPWSKISIDGCRCLKSLLFKSYNITEEEFHSLLSKLPLLEELCVLECEDIESIHISSPRLKTLVVFSDHITSIVVASPTLKNLILLSDGVQDNKNKIKVADCCSGLETLVLHNGVMKDSRFHKLIARFPMLKSLWIFECYKLRRIEIPNLQLTRLFIAKCSGLKAVKANSSRLSEIIYRGRKDVEMSVPDPDCLVCDYIADDCRIPFWSRDLREMLLSLVIEKSIAKIIWSNCS